MYKKLLVALDGSEGSLRALKLGIEMAKAAGVDLHAVSVEEDLPKYAGTLTELDEYKTQADAHFNEMNREAEASARREGVVLHTNTVVGHEVEAIIRHVAEKGFELLLVGFHGHSAISERLFGSTTSALVMHCPCSTLIVK
jgi:nucleotide-binding universal stress UspA family protein